MRWPAIVKAIGHGGVAANLPDYGRSRAEFSWTEARAELNGLPGGRGLNIAHEAVDRHADGPQRTRVALRCISKSGATRDLTYAELREATNRFANVLTRLGVGKGDPVAVLSGRIPELYIAALGTLKNGSVFTDDVIKSSGHLIGPFEVESVLLEHPAVAEAGVIGKPDPVALEIVKAFVALKPGIEATDDLRRELLAFARVRLGAAVAPKEIDFRPSIPKNRAGKIMRRLLRARELGLPEGDISTLEVS
jgi:acyl-coenzyme A synthetase/AMP-(fatty) acid ligase